MESHLTVYQKLTSDFFLFQILSQDKNTLVIDSDCKAWYTVFIEAEESLSQNGGIVMTYNIPDKVYREIIAFAQQHNIEKITLFGSRAKGNNSERSDIDIAVSGGDFDSFYFDIKEKTHSLLMIDVIELDKQVSDELKKEINAYGVVIYEKT